MRWNGRIDVYKRQVNTRELISTVERVSLVINDRLKSPLVCEFQKGRILFSCTSPLGSANDAIEAQVELSLIHISLSQNTTGAPFL